MSYTETTTNSYWSRVWNSFKWILIGIILVVCSIWVLWWNEWRTIDTAKWLSEAEEITVKWNTEKLDSSLEWKIVYNKGLVDTNDILFDKEFNIKEKAIKLDRIVQMYQWKEYVEEKTEDNMWWSETVIKTYTYEKVWSPSHLSSSKYKELWHSNPIYWPYENKEYVSNKVFLWVITLNNYFINQLDEYTNYILSKEDLYNFKKVSNITKKVNIESNHFYIWNNSILNPKIWDIKISFKTVKPSVISTIWVQKWNMLVPYISSRDTKVWLVEYWITNQKEMYVNAQNTNTMMAWIFRAAWLFFMFIGFKLIFDVFVTITKFIPFLLQDKVLLNFWLTHI